MSIWDAPIEFANRVYTWAYIGLVIGAALTAIATMSLFWASAIRDKDADTQIARAKADAARALAQAADANEKAEAERLARVKIEERLAGRSMSSSDDKKIFAEISQFSGTPIHIFIAGNTMEIDNIAKEIAHVLSDAHWRPTTWTWSGIESVQGIIVMIKPGASDESTAAAKALNAALNSARLNSIERTWPGGDWAHFGGMLNGPSFNANEAEIRVIIGAKPE